ncbi:S-layer homology domain-containing protein [Ferviditalea candida]|uniref:S-layer homology domain-containing protein n=1 Tax=Ferviditalea candida TaxID=3108399 RepID=UPI00352DFBDB
MFFPNATLTRAEYLAMLDRIFQFKSANPGSAASVDAQSKSEPSPEKSFADLDSRHWAYAVLVEVVDRRFIQGFEDGTIRPDQAVTRAEIRRRNSNRQRKRLFLCLMTQHPRPFPMFPIIHGPLRLFSE